MYIYMIINVYWVHVKYPLFFSDFLLKINLFGHISQKHSNKKILRKSVPWEPSFPMLIFVFRNFAKSPKKDS